MLLNGLLRYTFFTHAQTSEVTRVQSATDSFGTYFTHVKPVMQLVFKVLYGMDCFGTYCTHVQTFDVTRVQSAIRNGLLRYRLHTCQTCDVTRVQSAMDCFGTYCTHDQTCDATRVQSATEWTASVHTAHMSKLVK